MLLVDLTQTAGVETALFGGGRLLYTRQVRGPADLTLWILHTRAQSTPTWKGAELRLITSLNVRGWMDLFTLEAVDQLHLLAPRDSCLTLTACHWVDQQRHASGQQSLSFKLDAGIASVADGPPPFGPVKETSKVWRLAAAHRRASARAGSR